MLRQRELEDFGEKAREIDEMGGKCKKRQKMSVLCRKRINKTFLVIGFQFLIICFRGKPINREKSCKKHPEIIKNKIFVKVLIGAFRY